MSKSTITYRYNTNLIFLTADIENYKSESYRDELNNTVLQDQIIVTRKKHSFYEDQTLICTGDHSSYIPFTQALSSAKTFRELITFFANSYLKFSYVNFVYIPQKHSGNTIDSSDTSNELQEIKCRYFFRESRTANSKVQFDAPYSKIRDHFQDILNNWSTHYSKLKFIIDSYIRERRVSTYLENSLLNSIRNLEIFHRNFLEIPEKESLELDNAKEKVTSYISKNLDSPMKEKFIRNINFDSKVTLRTRLKELFRNLPEYLKEILKYRNNTISQSISLLVDKLVDTRNYYTHGDDLNEYKNRINDRKEMHLTNLKLVLVLEYYIFNTLGLPDHIISEVLSDNMRNIRTRSV